MASARLWLTLLLTGLLAAVAYGQKNLCKGKVETCVSGQQKVGGTCVNVTGSTASCVGNAHIENNWFYPEKKDLCSLGECFCYCVRKGYYFTVFIPTAKTSDRVPNNQGQLVQKSGKCWCHNFAGHEWYNKKVPMSRCGSKNHAILVKNGMSNTQRKINEKSFYNCAVVLPNAAVRSTEMKAAPPGLPGASALQQCIKGEDCYDSTTIPEVGQTPHNMKKASECYCKCFTMGYFFGGWIESSKTCKCFNKQIKRGKAPSCAGAKLKVLFKSSTRKTNCCKAAKETPKPKVGSRSQQMSGVPPGLPGTPKTKKPKGSSRSQAVPGAPPGLPGTPKTKKPKGSSRSQAVPGAPPGLPGTPKTKKPKGSSRSQAVPGAPPGLPGTPKTKKPKGKSRSQETSGSPPTLPGPNTPTVGLADEPDWELPDDIDTPDPEDMLPPLDDTIDYIFEYPPYEPMPPEYLDPLVLNPPKEPNWPEPNTDKPDDITFFITDLGFLDFPPESPQWPITFVDWPWPDAPLVIHVGPPVDEFPPPYEYPLPLGFSDPMDWEPEWDVPLDPLDWRWPLDDTWTPFPDLAQFLPSILSPGDIFWYS